MGVADKFGMLMFGISMIGLGVLLGIIIGFNIISIIPIGIGIIALYFLKKG